jgi:acyl carrier protein
MSADIRNTILNVIRTVAEERGLQLPTINDDTEIVDELGFSSLTVAALIANLEEELGVDPFQDEDTMITDIRTVGDLCKVYGTRLERAA